MESLDARNFRGPCLMVELIACPECKRQLQVPELYLGQTVQCPECRHRFVAVTSSISAQPLPTTSRPDNTESKLDRDDDDDDDFDDIRQLRHRRADWEPHRGGMILALGLVALVGGMLFCLLPTVLGPLAWMLGNWDLRAMHDGHMDSSGESMTRTGQVCGIVATVLLILGGLYVCLAFLADLG
jgi:uncharacterized protein YbaR (Trm112 family)